MNRCPNCQRSFESTLKYCSACGVDLVSASEAATLRTSYQTQQLPALALKVTVQPKDGDRQTYRDNEWAGTKRLSRPLEGFSISLAERQQDLSLRYKGHFQGDVVVDWVNEGEFLIPETPKGEEPKRLEAFSIELTGPAADDYDILYSGHLQDWDDTRCFMNGALCGERKRRVEAIKVWILPRVP